MKGQSNASEQGPGSTRHADLSPRGEDKGGKRSWRKDRGVKTAKSKECHCCVTSSHNRSEYRVLLTAVRQKFAQRGRTSWRASAEVDPEAGKRKCSRGVDMATSAHELDEQPSMQAMMVGVSTCTHSH